MLAGVLGAAPAAPAAKDTPPDRFDVYAGEIGVEQLDKVVETGVDRSELQIERVPGATGRLRVEVILSGSQAEELSRRGLKLSPKRNAGMSAAQAAAGFEVFKKYGGPGGIKQELEQVAVARPKIAKLVNVGKSLNGQDIVALKVTKDAVYLPDGTRPSVLYLGAQHAREWITPEMVRRLMHHIVNGYAGDSAIKKLVDENELWFLPVANPDGYDFTFEPDQRLWRKNLRDNNGDNQITPVDGVDLNRNFATKWGYDNEGSSPIPSAENYRGTGPSSEPETKVLDALAARASFQFLVTYHSAAQLLLYGTAWQVATPTPDDVIHEALAGDDSNPAVPGYDPDISAELYTVNGDTGTHITEKHHTLAFTPEMSTCESASDSVPADEWEAGNCPSIFHFPDDEALIQAEFLKNLPFALSVARSAKTPDYPVSVVGRSAEDFRVDSFSVSYGDPQTVAVIARRSTRGVIMYHRINGGTALPVTAVEWAGGERYGDENDEYYAEMRAQVRGARPGDNVEVWFTGVRPDRRTVRSPSFTYTLAKDTGAKVLVVANEDYTGVNPTYPPGTTAPKYAAAHLAALQAAGYTADLWDVDAQGVPHPLSVLSHYKAVLWYLGDNRLTQDPEDERIQSPIGDLVDMAVKEEQQELTMSIRDYLNEGGKLIHSGETTQYDGPLSGFVGGLYYGLNGNPNAECVISSFSGFGEDCLIMSDDFRQYYLGAFTRDNLANPNTIRGLAAPLTGFTGPLGGPVVTGANPLNEAGEFTPISDVLPAAQFPQFTSRGVADYLVGGAAPFGPIEGSRYAGAVHKNSAYMRLTRTIDVPAAASAGLHFQLNLDVEPGFDNFIVEAHTVGQDNWTTLPEVDGRTASTQPANCIGTLQIHPFLNRYLSADCSGPGSSGVFRAITGSTGGWQPVSYDLSAFAGSQVEVSISYVSDPVFGGSGAFVDATRVVINGVEAADGFEGATSAWVPASAPAGSPVNGGWQIGPILVNLWGGVATADTLLLGFGLEQLASDAARTALVQKALTGLIP